MGRWTERRSLDPPADGQAGWWLAAALPTLLTLLALLLLDVGAPGRIRHELEERATLIANALAEASEYGLVSGNAAALDRSVRELLAHDKSIASIDILDAARRPFVSLPGQPPAAGLPTVEWPVRSSVPDIDFFDRATPHVSLADDLQPTFRPGPVAGYVRVTMTTEALQRAQRQRLGLQLAAVALAGVAGLLLARLLVRRRPASASEADGAALAAAPMRPATLPERSMARRLLGRLDAALVTVRLAALQAARQAEAAGAGADEAAVQSAARTAARVLALADQAEAAGAALLDALRPQLLAAVGLDNALAELLQACTRALPGCHFDLQIEPGFACPDARQAAEIHCVVQHALLIVVANARASQAQVHLQSLASTGEPRVVVTDNGIGTPATAAARLTQLQEVLAARGARVEVAPTAAGGTMLAVTVPAGAG